MALVGLVVLAVYTGAGLGGLVVLQWIVADPPPLWIVLVTFAVGIPMGGYVAYRFGTARLIGRLEARRLARTEVPELHRRLARLTARMDVREPRVLAADLTAPNALSIGGPRRGAIVFDYRLLRSLTIDELEGVLAHELAHMEGRDTLINTIVLTTIRTIVGIVFVLLFPIVLFLAGIDRGAAWMAGTPGRRRYGLTTLFHRGLTAVLGAVLSLFTLAFLARARRREFVVDNRAAEVTGDPASLARALVKIHRASKPRRRLLSVLYIEDEGDSPVKRWFSSHPPLEKRIERLLEKEERNAAHRHVRLLRR